ncbi:D-glycerate dehydrogenase [Candidatus Woesearchaeota archaeon]|nr:D-glycerate dehydrogenase [Candidatus Woesearchaeota archaeon]
MKVFVTRQIPETGISMLRKKYSVTVSKKNRALTKKELIAGTKGKDALLCLLTDKIDMRVLKASKKLKVVANYAVGFDNIDVKAASKLKIPVTNTPGVLTDAVADHACALMLGISRRIAESDKFVRAGKYRGWEPMLLLGGDFRNKTLGILGLGRIGSAVAESMHRGFGMKILYYDIKKNMQFERSVKAKFSSVQQVMKNSDYISVHVPLLPATRHLVGAKELRMMKKSAYLINTSRGPVVDEKALVKALRKKQIAGAALDVFEKEPKLSAGLAKLDNVILTPHTASATNAARNEMSRIAAKNIIAVLSGKKAPNAVNPEIYQ